MESPTGCLLVPVQGRSSVRHRFPNVTEVFLFELSKKMKLKNITLCLLAFASITRADIVAQWSFPTGFDTTSPLPSVGSGAASRVGGTTGSQVVGTGSTDPVQPGSSWSTATYPAQGTANKTAGVK